MSSRAFSKKQERRGGTEEEKQKEARKGEERGVGKEAPRGRGGGGAKEERNYHTVFCDFKLFFLLKISMIF